MGNFQHGQKEKEKREAQKAKRRDKNAALFFDFAKLSFGGMVIGSFAPLFGNGDAQLRWWIPVSGLVATSIFVYIGNKFLK